VNARGGADKKESNRSKMNVLGEEWQKGGLRREQTLSSVFFCSLNLNPKIPLSFLFYVLRLSFPVAAFLYVFVPVKPSSSFLRNLLVSLTFSIELAVIGSAWTFGIFLLLCVFSLFFVKVRNTRMKI
jgi:hypothetical protein